MEQLWVAVNLSPLFTRHQVVCYSLIGSDFRRLKAPYREEFPRYGLSMRKSANYSMSFVWLPPPVKHSAVRQRADRWFSVSFPNFTMVHGEKLFYQIFGHKNTSPGSDNHCFNVCKSTGGPKSKLLPNYQKIALHYIKVFQLNHICFVKLKRWSSTIIMSVGIKYCLRDLLSDVNNYAWPTK